MPNRILCRRLLGCSAGAWLGWNPYRTPTPQACPPFLGRSAFARPSRVDAKVDLAMSLKVVEHLQPSVGEQFVSCRTDASDVILFLCSVHEPGRDEPYQRTTAFVLGERVSTSCYSTLDLFRPVFWADGRRTSGSATGIDRTTEHVSIRKDRERTVPAAGQHGIGAAARPAPDHGPRLRGQRDTSVGTRLGFIPVVPPLGTRVSPGSTTARCTKRRNEVETLFRRLKGSRRIFSRTTPTESGCVNSPGPWPGSLRCSPLTSPGTPSRSSWKPCHMDSGRVRVVRMSSHLNPTQRQSSHR